MPRVSSKAHDERTSRKVRVRDLNEAQIRCRSFGHEWEEDPTADWHTPRYEYINCYRFYFRCRRGCGNVKVGIWTADGRWVSGYSQPPAGYRVHGIGRGAGRRPFIAEYIARQGLIPTGRKRVSDKARRKSA